MNAPKPPLPRPPIFALVFMSMFGFIGIGVLVFIWSQPGDFPPLIFKFVASCIAIAFMAMGFGAPISMLKNRNAPDSTGSNTEGTGDGTSAKGYKCPNCGAGLAQQEVSPSGDVKCTYCLKWWNIHNRVHNE
jgi:hypothetical protein